ncbi:MAG: FKBP-type peptidyl-prolyl cis-trans isomerase [Bacteroidales bacterium]|jgi:FKBP-type peptidyl-prolyl cis-trans isomerase|nr:FKBP-type peptidyl-prolyl cis-trans isomerase [Bacteroidales bacterium]
MKIRGLIVSVVIATLFLGACAKSSVSGIKIKSREDSLSYAFGIVNYNALKSDSLNLNPMVIAKAMIDGQEGNPAMSDETARSFIMQFISEREEAKMAKQQEMEKVNYLDHIKENEDFLAKNKEKAGVTETPSGLQYEVITMGTGPKPTAADKVKVHYTGTLIDGTEFDSSIKRNEPAEFPLAQVIPGWTEGLQLMPVGSKFRLFLPENLAYGANGAGPQVKPYSTLIFEVELLDIVK